MAQIPLVEISLGIIECDWARFRSTLLTLYPNKSRRWIQKGIEEELPYLLKSDLVLHMKEFNPLVNVGFLIFEDTKYGKGMLVGLCGEDAVYHYAAEYYGRIWTSLQHSSILPYPTLIIAGREAERLQRAMKSGKGWESRYLQADE